MKNISNTFHGRDVFAPAAAHIACGTALKSLGKEVDSIIKLNIPGYDLELIDQLEFPFESEKIYWTAKNMYFGGVHAVFKDKKGNLEPAGDRRRVGAIRKLLK